MKRFGAGGKYRELAALLLFLLPVLAYWVDGLIVRPAPNYAGIDPEYEYFLNSLGAFRGQPYLYLDHPGTPVEMIGTAILAATYPAVANHPGGFIEFHLRNPQFFLRLAYVFLVLAHMACMIVFFVVARRTAERKGAMLAAALATMYFAIQPYAFSGSLLWSHNSFSFPFGTLLLLWLYASLSIAESGAEASLRTWIGIGVGVGVLAATTIFLASWIVGAVVALVLYYGLAKHAWRRMALTVVAFTLSSAAGFYLAVLPVLNRMGGFWNWIYSILSHQGNYLAVPDDQTIWQRIAANAANLFQMLPALSLVMLICVALGGAAAILWRRRLKEQPALWALAGGLAAQMVALTLVFLDRPLRAYYFLGVAAILPVLAMVLMRLLEQAPKAQRVVAAGISILVLVGLVANTVSAIASRSAELGNQARSEEAVQQAIRERAQDTGRAPGDLTLLWMYGAYSNCWGLWFGNHRSGDAFDRDITRICPNQYELAGRVLVPNGKIPLEDMKWDIVFTCERYTDMVLAKQPGAEVRVQGDIEWACGKMATVYHR